MPRFAKATCKPVEIQYSCGFREDHLSENSAYVPHSATALLPLPRPLTRQRSVAGAAASGATSRMLSVIPLLFFRG